MPTRHCLVHLQTISSTDRLRATIPQQYDVVLLLLGLISPYHTRCSSSLMQMATPTQDTQLSQILNAGPLFPPLLHKQSLPIPTPLAMPGYALIVPVRMLFSAQAWWCSSPGPYASSECHITSRACHQPDIAQVSLHLSRRSVSSRPTTAGSIRSCRA